MHSISKRAIREAARVSMIQVAVRANVSEATIRCFELNEADGVVLRTKREAINRVYGEIAADLERHARR